MSTKSPEQDIEFDSMMKKIEMNPASILDFQSNPDFQRQLFNNFPNYVQHQQQEIPSADTPEGEKSLGNEAFRRGDYQTALIHYNRAIKMDESNIIYYTNRATVLIKLGKFSDASESCLLGIEAGQKNNASLEQIAKAYYKLGVSEEQSGNKDSAKIAFQCSLEKHEDPNIRKKLLSLS